MKIIEPTCGYSIENAVAQLVAAAPARMTFNDMVLRARYRTTKAADIVARYMGTIGSSYPKDTPESRREKRRNDAEIAERQATIDACMRDLDALDFDDSAAVVRWIERIAEPADRVGVRLDMPAIVARFGAQGWGANVNTGEAFDKGDARNFAGWIVGQWLANGYPNVDMFAAESTATVAA